MLITFKTYLRTSAARMAARVRRAPQAEEGAAAIEFGMMMPILIAIFFGVTEISAYNMHARRAQQSVDFAAEYLSRDNDNVLSREERHVAEDIWQIVNVTSFNTTGGDAYENSRGKYSRSFASAEFVEDPDSCLIPGVGNPGRGRGNAVGLNGDAPGNSGNTPAAENSRGRPSGSMRGRPLGCDYMVRLDWSFLATQGISDPKRRTCVQTLVPNDEPLDETTLPEGIVSRGGIVIADFTYRYEPLFQLDFLPMRETHITAIRMSRSGQLLRNSETSTSHMVYCGATP